MLEALRFSCFRFYLSPLEPATLPMQEHPGARLRDRFGVALKYAVCPQPRQQCRAGCAAPHGCPYALLFETSKEAIEIAGLDGRDLPRPFVLEPPLDRKRHYRPGETMAFQLLLVGRAREHLSCFIAAFEEMGRHGFGVEQTPWEVRRVVALKADGAEGGAVYNAETRRMMPMPPDITSEQVAIQSESLSAERIALQLVTPLRLEERGRLLRELGTFSITRALLRRLSRLALVWCDSPLDLDYRALLDRWAGTVQCCELQISCETWSRHASRSSSELKLEGLRGQLVLQGDLAELRLFLKYGEYLHLGKQTAFGLGQYRCG